MRCDMCGNPIDQANDYRLVTGWERIHRSQGGTNALRVPDRTSPKRACQWCIRKLASGVPALQGSLLDD